MAKESNSTIEQKKPSLKEAVVELKKDTNNSLSPLAYGTINKSTEGNLDSLQYELVFHEKLKRFEKIVKTKAKKTWIEKFSKNTGKIGQNIKDDFVENISGDPEVDLAFKDLVSFDRTNVTISGGVLAYQYLSGKTKKAIHESKGKSALKKSLAIMKPALITNIILQPGVLAGVGSLGKNIVGKGIYNVSGITKNAIYGIVSGDLLKETMKIGKNGNPAEYLWNGKTHTQRTFELLKNPKIYSTPQELRKYFDPELKETFKSIEGYSKNPKNIEPYISSSAEFVFRSAQSSFSEEQLKTFIINMEAGVWNEKMIKKAIMTSASGGILKFFLETATKEHRKKFMEEFSEFSNKKNPPKPFTDKDLEKKFPKISKKCTKKEKKGIQAALSLGASGLAVGAFLLTTLISKILSKFGQSGFDLTDPGNGGLERVSNQIKASFVRNKDGFKRFKKYELKRFKSFLEKRKAKNSFAMLGGKKGILTDKEIDNLTGKKVTNIQRSKIIEELQKFMGKEKKKITVDEFWELDSVKKLKGKNLKEKT